MTRSFYVGAPPLMKSLTARQCNAVRAAAERREFPAGAMLYLRGDPDPELVIVHEGEVELGNVNLDGSFAVSGRMRPGYCFGEGAMLSGLPRSFAARTRTGATIDLLSVQAYRALIAKHPEIGEAVTRIMAERFQRLLEFVDDLRRQPLNVQLAKALLTLSGNRERDGGVGATPSELSGLLGTSDVAVITALGRFEREGLLRRRPHGIDVPDRAALENWVARRTMRNPPAVRRKA